MPDNTKSPLDQLELGTAEVLANDMTTRQKILEAARKMISQEGLGAVSMMKGVSGWFRICNQLLFNPIILPYLSQTS